MLREVAVVAAEDTRHTGQLLAHYGIAARYLSLHEHNERERVADDRRASRCGRRCRARLRRGDAADRRSRRAGRRGGAAGGHPVVPMPGPSALLAAVVASGIVPGPFTFVGFLPPKRGARRSALESLRALPHPIICYEAPHRLARDARGCLDVLGDRAVRALPGVDETARRDRASRRSAAALEALDDEARAGRIRGHHRRGARVRAGRRPMMTTDACCARLLASGYIAGGGGEGGRGGRRDLTGRRAINARSPLNRRWRDDRGRSMPAGVTGRLDREEGRAVRMTPLADVQPATGAVAAGGGCRG